MFFRTGAWVMHLVSPEKAPGEPEFESSLSIDSHARADLMRQVCDHGLCFQAKAEELVHRADAICPYSNAVRGNVVVAITVRTR
jgi:organic hydroperoxide reductase OsmC/OhrA